MGNKKNRILHIKFSFIASISGIDEINTLKEK